MNWEYVGALAGLLTMFSFFPQIIKMRRNRSAADVSLIMMLQYTLGITLWLLYGIHLNNNILIISNAVSLSSFIGGIFLYFRYTGKKRPQEGT